jgi:hypothetical protein
VEIASLLSLSSRNEVLLLGIYPNTLDLITTVILFVMVLSFVGVISNTQTTHL